LLDFRFPPFQWSGLNPRTRDKSGRKALLLV
jgi:hypothetical protein